MKKFLLILLTIGSCSAGTFPTPWLPRVFSTYSDMASKANASNYSAAIFILGATNINDGYGGWFFPTNTASGTNLYDRIADKVATSWSWQRVTLATNIASGASVYVGGSLVSNPNLAGAQFTAVSTNVYQSSTALVTNNAAIANEIALTSGTNFIFNPLISCYSGTATGNFYMTIGTNTMTDATKRCDIYFACYSASAYVGTPYGSLTNYDARGVGTTTVTNAIGTNYYHFFWGGGVWHLDQDTAPVNGTFVNGTLDAARSDLTIKLTDYKDFIYPGRVDGTGCTITTNDYTSGVWGLAAHAGTGGTNVNYAIYKVGTVPLDLDTGVTMVLKNLAFRVSGSDTGSASFSIAYFSPASSSAASPSDYTALSGYATFTSGTLTSPAAGDVFYMADVTLTGWASGLTAGRPLIIGIARDGGDANNDTLTILGGTISYGRTQ